MLHVQLNGTTSHWELSAVAALDGVLSSAGILGKDIFIIATRRWGEKLEMSRRKGWEEERDDIERVGAHGELVSSECAVEPDDLSGQRIGREISCPFVTTPQE